MTKLQVTVKPNSKKGPLVITNSDGSLTVYLREKPADNQANIALINLLSGHLKIPKTQIKITKGLASRQKTIVTN